VIVKLARTIKLYEDIAINPAAGKHWHGGLAKTQEKQNNRF
jgi:hypothetical protein